jgi:signal transduction histidine kinase
MQHGASDYLLKDRLTRLPAAVRRALAEAELRREYGRSRVALAFLAQASIALSQSLDAAAIAETVLGLAVPLLTDAAAVDVLDEEGRPQRVTEGPIAVPDAPAAEAMRGLAPVMVPAGAEAGQGADGTWTALPFVLRGVAFGCLTLAGRAGAGGRRLGEDGVGAELAARAAVALQNARLYEQSRAAIATRDEFLQIAAHELRTPLTPLSTHVQTLLRSARAADASVPVSRFDAEIEATGQHVQRLAKLVDHLLDVAKFRTGAPPLERGPCDLAELSAAIVSELAPQARDAGSTLEVDAAPVVGWWDRARLEQVLRSLVTNALKFGAGRPVWVTVERADAAARVEVRDAGPGIAAVDHARIFERFERAVPLHRYGGFGLGLWTAREILRAHGGTIAVASAPGEGATFTVEIPLAPPAEPLRTDT